MAVVVALVTWSSGIFLEDLPGGRGAWLGGTGADSVAPRGPVSHVRDGDTIEVAGVAVRLANLDCAARGTTQGEAASERMSELVAREAVACELEGRRSYDREVGTCELDRTGEDLGEVLIGEGVCGRWR